MTGRRLAAAAKRPEMYERSPDGERWPGTLKGLLAAIEDTTLKSLREGGDFTLMAIRHGQSVPFRVYRDGTYKTGGF